MQGLFGGLGDQGGDTAFGIANQQFQAGLPLMQQAVQQARGGYTEAISAVGGLGAGQERRAQDNITRSLANVRSQMRGSGLGNTTAMAGAQFGALEAGNRNLLDVQDMRARTMAPLYAGRGQATSGALQRLAQYRQGFAQQMMGGAGQAGSLSSNFQFQAGESTFSQNFAGPLGALMGMFSI